MITVPLPLEFQGRFAAARWFVCADQWVERQSILNNKDGLYRMRDGHGRLHAAIREGKAAEYLVQSILNKCGLTYDGPDVVLSTEEVMAKRSTAYDLTPRGDYQPVEVKVSGACPLVYLTTSNDPKFHPGKHAPFGSGVFVGAHLEGDYFVFDIVAHMAWMANEAPEWAFRFDDDRVQMPHKRRINALHVALHCPDAVITSLDAFRAGFVPPVSSTPLMQLMASRKHRWERQVANLNHQ